MVEVEGCSVSLCEECVSVRMESRPAKAFSAIQGRSIGVSSTEKFKPSVMYLRLLSSLAPSGAALSLLLAFLLWLLLGGQSDVERTCYTRVPPVKSYGPLALLPHPRLQ